MDIYKNEFIRFCLSYKVLKFGEFKLKSGRISPYFFNAGLFNTGIALSKLSEFYVRAIQTRNIFFDMVFGPAYKAIPLVCSVALTFANLLGVEKPFAFNRKEVKNHGEGGQIIGAPLGGNVLIIDDVITAGTAIRESIQLIIDAGAIPAAILIALDRQECGEQEGLSAIQEIQQQFDIPVFSIIKLDDIITFVMNDEQTHSYLEKISQYRQQYGIADNSGI